ncbi:HD domain-containing phosphohydrolase [Catenuloplanes sp. NPDC051500]|uniref:HD domain-containing phosphohydrolase n=1 Tax=Catenuloplanes sp. NPDC051500 TaxID=3363959 RepID=UPI00379BC973
MPTGDQPRILLVDDEPDLLDGLRRQLRREFDVETAVGAANGLFALGKGAPFTVIVSDFMMPGINGAQFLAAARKAAPSATRMLLTGHTNLADAASTVNQGGVFRMLLKPVEPETMVAALRDSVAQHRLVVAERELLEQTLRGSVQALTDVLSLVSPAGFGRGTRMRRVASAVLDSVEVEDRWAMELAVQMSQLGVVSLPPPVAARLVAGAELSPAEQLMVDRMPEVAEQLISPIPRLGVVAEAIRYSRKGFDGSGTPADGTAGERIPFGGRLLRLIEDHDALLAQGVSPTLAIATLRSSAGLYDPALLDALETAAATAGGVHGVPLAEVQCGMVLAAPVTSLSGVLLVNDGQEVTAGLLTRLRNFAELEDGVAEPVMVLDVSPSDPAPTG